MPLRLFFFSSQWLLRDILMPFRHQTVEEEKGNKICENSPVIIPHLPSLNDLQLLISVLLSFYTDTLSISRASAALLLSDKQQTVHLPHSITDTDLVPDKDEVSVTRYLIQHSLFWLIVCWRFRTTPSSLVSIAALNTSTEGVVQWTVVQNIASLGYINRNVFNNKFEILSPSFSWKWHTIDCMLSWNKKAFSKPESDFY